MPKAKPVKRILNVVPSRDTDRDWRLEHADQAGLLAAPRRAAVPASKDLRTAWWKVGDQGDLHDPFALGAEGAHIPVDVPRHLVGSHPVGVHDDLGEGGEGLEREPGEEAARPSLVGRPCGGRLDGGRDPDCATVWRGGDGSQPLGAALRLRWTRRTPP